MVIKAKQGMCVISMDEAETMLQVLRGDTLTEAEIEAVEALKERLWHIVLDRYKAAAEWQEKPVEWQAKPFDLVYRDGWIEIVQEA